MRSLISKKPNDRADKPTAEQENLLELIRRRAENLFASSQMMCSEAVMATLNQGLGGGLPPELAFKLASSQSNGIGGRGCVCGAFNGGVLALGLFFGREKPGFGNGKYVRALAGELHDRFIERFGTTCCRALTKKVKHDPKRQFQHCCQMTGIGAVLAARIILEERPKLAHKADRAYLEKRDTAIGAGLRKVRDMLKR